MLNVLASANARLNLSLKGDGCLHTTVYERIKATGSPASENIEMPHWTVFSPQKVRVFSVKFVWTMGVFIVLKTRGEKLVRRTQILLRSPILWFQRVKCGKWTWTSIPYANGSAMVHTMTIANTIRTDLRTPASSRRRHWYGISGYAQLCCSPCSSVPKSAPGEQDIWSLVTQRITLLSRHICSIQAQARSSTTWRWGKHT